MKSVHKAPIALFVYNRPWHTQLTVEALQKNELASESELFIYSDEAKNIDAKANVDEVRRYVNKHGNIIVLEDDLVTSPYFLKYMNTALDFYKDEESVASIHGYIYPIEGLPDSFFIKGSDCWGWATWKNKWDIFEPSGQKLLDELTLKNLAKEADFNGSYDFTEMLKS